MRAAPLITRLGLSLAALGAALVAAELAVERWFPVGGFVYRLDAELLHDARPDAARIQLMPRARVGPGDAARVLVTTGPEGMRGRGLDRSGERPRVLVMGDSLVMAENVPAGSTRIGFVKKSLLLAHPSFFTLGAFSEAGPTQVNHRAASTWEVAE